MTVKPDTPYLHMPISTQHAMIQRKKVNIINLIETRMDLVLAIINYSSIYRIECRT